MELSVVQIPNVPLVIFWKSTILSLLPRIEIIKKFMGENGISERIVCSYCQILYDLKEPLEDDSISHGICEECWPWVQHNLEIELAQIEESQCHLSGSPKPFVPQSGEKSPLKAMT